MDVIEILKKIDDLAADANSFWHRCENLKKQIAKTNGVSNGQMKANGIYIDEPPSNT